jgi:2-phospho-L-lactate transferase/gluconeogenesis factor (CofD/UPF0052 family)
VLFSGGRGSGALTEQLVTNPRIALTVVINGYDDGASTGEVRRFLGDALGPSDFRKNASRLARSLGSCPASLLDLLDTRLDPALVERDTAARIASIVGGNPDGAHASDPRLAPLRTRAEALAAPVRAAVARPLERLAQELDASVAPFNFSDCSVGNLVFAGGFLLAGRSFNTAVDDYCARVGLPPGLIDNITDGTNAFLVAIDADGRFLGSEEQIVDATRHNRIDDIFLIAAPPTADEARTWTASPREEVTAILMARSAPLRLNPRAAEAIGAADLIVYAPGTQHSSLFPSYLTPGLSAAIAANLTAIKLLVTNIQSDAEITGSSAVDIVDRAMFYLQNRGRLSIATPCLITHYLLNDPGRAASDSPYVPLGRLESIEDPRLVRVANFEEAGTGRHDAAKILGPFVDSFLARWTTSQKVAVLLHEASTTNKVVQTVLEMVRGGIRDLPVDLTVFHDGPAEVDDGFVVSPGFPVRRLGGDERERDRTLRSILQKEAFDYVILFESSGMYNGEDIATLASYLNLGRLDAVWGSRRLSVRDIHQSYRLKYRHRTVLGAVSYAGSHALSLLYLALFGRYVSDTLSAARAVRVADAVRIPIPLTHKLANQHLLSMLLRREAEMFEVPVQFFSISPEQVRRTTPLDGLRAIATAVRARLRPAVSADPAPASVAPARRGEVGAR